MRSKAEVLQPGLFSTIQDRGRFGYREFGVPVSGAMDSSAAATANLLLQNDSEAAVLEITQTGPQLRFTAPTQIAVCGANFAGELDGEPIELNTVHIVESNNILDLRKRISGHRVYLAVKGGFQTELVLGSRSWFGGITSVERLEKGMNLPYVQNEEQLSDHHAGINTDFLDGDTVEAYPGPEYHLLNEQQKKSLSEGIYTLGHNTNRMGIQLEEEIANDLLAMMTGPVVPGTVQLTPSGKLVVLMKDAQTTGGYPRVLQLSEQGMCSIAQKLTGENLHFEIHSR